jgi:hypothetical protein
VQRRRPAPRAQDGPHEVEHRARVLALGLDAARPWLGRPRQPRLDRPAVAAARPSTAAARGSRRARRDRRRARGHDGVLEPELLPGVEERRAAQRQQQQRAARARASEPPRRVRMRGWSWLEKTHVGHRAPMIVLDLGDPRRHAAASHGTTERLEVEGEMQLVVGAEVGRDQRGLGQVDLADHHALAGYSSSTRAHAAQELVGAA